MEVVADQSVALLLQLVAVSQQPAAVDHLPISVRSCLGLQVVLNQDYQGLVAEEELDFPETELPVLAVTVDQEQLSSNISLRRNQHLPIQRMRYSMSAWLSHSR